MKVSELRNIRFTNLSFERKMDIKKAGPPRPNLNITQGIPACKSKGAYTRKFDADTYKRADWLCGCDDTNTLYCFVCLLYGGEDSWTKGGVKDLKHLSIKITKHENSCRHKNNYINLKLLDKKNVAHSLSTACTDSLPKHNETVRNNRTILSKLIDVIKFCTACNLSFRSRDGTNDPLNKGVFSELLNYTQDIDPALKFHLESATVFKGSMETIQNELLDCMLQICRESISNEIHQSSFLVCMVDDTTDVSAGTQTSIVFRYELNGSVHERLWGFFKPESEDAGGISRCVLSQLEKLLENYPEKLVAQTYDGTAVTGGNLGGVNIEIKQMYSNAHYIYCYAHQFDKLLEQAASQNSSARSFFANLSGITEFFCQPPDRMAALNGICPKPSTPWNFQTRVAETVFENKDILLAYFEGMVSGVPKTYTAETVDRASGFVRTLNDEVFRFWLEFFSNVMPPVEMFYKQALEIYTDPVNIKHAVYGFQAAISTIRDRLQSVDDDFAEVKAEDDPPPQKRKKLHNANEAAIEICDIVMIQATEQFDFISHFAGAKLFRNEMYSEYKKRLPLEEIQEFCNAYPNILNKDLLTTELKIFYCRPELEDTGFDLTTCLKLLNFIYSFGLEPALREITKALKIVITLPMPTAEIERCFCTLKLIKNFLRNTMVEDRLSALGMLSIEKELVKEIPNFNEKVIEEFCCSENRRTDFSYKY